MFIYDLTPTYFDKTQTEVNLRVQKRKINTLTKIFFALFEFDFFEFNSSLLLEYVRLFT